MAVAVLVPSALRSLTDNQARVEAQGDTLRQVIEDLERQYPGFGQRLRNPDGSIRRFVNVYINGEDIRAAGGLDAAPPPGSRRPPPPHTHRAGSLTSAPRRSNCANASATASFATSASPAKANTERHRRAPCDR